MPYCWDEDSEQRIPNERRQTLGDTSADQPEAESAEDNTAPVPAAYTWGSRSEPRTEVSLPQSEAQLPAQITREPPHPEMDFRQIPNRVPFSTHEYSDTCQPNPNNSDTEHRGLTPIIEEPESAPKLESEPTETADSSDNDFELKISNISGNTTDQSAEMDDFAQDTSLIPQLHDNVRDQPIVDTKSTVRPKRPRRWNNPPELSQHSSSDELRPTMKKAARREITQTARDLRRENIPEDELTHMTPRSQTQKIHAQETSHSATRPDIHVARLRSSRELATDI
ncbi:hypothetical protein GQ54DRAFT_340315 [Martensiomyces pterosporus]|nr:hypothetical protein GQ54DRAFT_340315 [Martensiomyces pterosporus]